VLSFLYNESLYQPQRSRGHGVTSYLGISQLKMKLLTNNNKFKFKLKYESSKATNKKIMFLCQQECGLGRDVSVSKRSRDVLTSRLGQNPQRLGLGPMRLGSLLGLSSNISRSRPSRSRVGSRAIASRRDVLCRRVPCIL